MTDAGAAWELEVGGGIAAGAWVLDDAEVAAEWLV